MIDTHCHLTYPQLYSQLEAVLLRAEEAQVQRTITVGTSLADAARAIELCRRFGQVRCVIGIHPHHAAEATRADVESLAAMQGQSEVVALGEMGLDYHYDFSPRPRQQEIFDAQLELARKTGRPIVIHCREAIDDCLGMLRGYPGMAAVFHCFTGTQEEARRILDRGHMMGFTGVVTFRKSQELREVARFVPGDRILLETDAPYLAPEPQRKQRVNEPSLLVHTADTMARLRGLSRQELDRVTTENAMRFFRLARASDGFSP
jgi:TatD DNase family protein